MSAVCGRRAVGVPGCDEFSRVAGRPSTACACNMTATPCACCIPRPAWYLGLRSLQRLHKLAKLLVVLGRMRVVVAAAGEEDELLRLVGRREQSPRRRQGNDRVAVAMALQQRTVIGAIREAESNRVRISRRTGIQGK